MGRKFSKFETVILLCDISVLAVYAAKDELKFLFGRTWPESWGPNVTSLIRDNAYPASHSNQFPPAMPPCLLLLYLYYGFCFRGYAAYGQRALSLRISGLWQ
jgi:hypothetical protein